MQSAAIARSARSPLASFVRSAASAVLAFAVLTAGVCADDDADVTGTTGAGITGQYVLDGVQLPGTSVFANPNGQSFACGSNTCKLTSGSVTLASNGNFSLAVSGTERIGSGAETALSFSSLAGTYSAASSNITFTPAAGPTGTIAGTLASNTITAPISFGTRGTYTLRFRKS